MKIVFLLFPFLILFSCSSPQKSFKNGNYQRAFKKSLHKLENGEEDNNSKLILNKSLDKMIEVASKKIDKSIVNNNLKSWKSSLDEVNELIVKMDKAKPYLGSKFNAKQEILIGFQSNLESQLFNYYFDSGLENFKKAKETGLKKYAQEAYFDFNDSAEYYNEINSSEIEKYLSESLAMGMKYYVVEAKAPYDVFYQGEIDRVFRRLEDEIDQFEQIFYDRRSQQEFDCLIKIEFQRLNVDEDRHSESQSFSKSVIVRYETIRDSTGTWENPIYEDVYATVNKIVHVKRISWEVNVSVNAYSNDCNLDGRRFEEYETEKYEEIEIDGDKRAIPEYYQDIEIFPDYERRESQMVDDLIEKNYNEIKWQYFR